MWGGHLLFIYKHNPGGPTLTVPTRYMNTNALFELLELTNQTTVNSVMRIMNPTTNQSGHTYILGDNGYGHLSLIFSKTSLMS
ncbi:hypothetical protein XELAEV_18006569mg [Xenopus laevis]|uniref:Uncharacterized protein n=1 Tax=Xenopus laevis TaxID=8355 RepID=A0A974I4B0_XENLA|nr:hypothetical protein XELAEV_18006569mg [Xenopus laevis]